jgi:proline iminopeptidase
MTRHLLAVAVALAACAPAAPSVAPAPAAREGYLGGARGARIFYRVEGAGPDTVVAVHGGPGAGLDALRPDLEPLTRGHTVVFYDQRGGGRSELPGDTTLLDAQYFVEDLESVRRHFGIGRMKVVAHSFGPVLVARYMEHYPERVERAVFLGATGPQRASTDAYYRSLYQRADTAVLKRMFTALMPLINGTAPDVVAGCREYGAASREMARGRGEPVSGKGTECDMPPEALRYYFRYTARAGPVFFGDWDFTTSLRGVTAPVLVVHGDVDEAAIPAQRAWAAAFPQGRLLLVTGAGKGAHSDRPDLVFPAIEAFLAGRWPAGAVISRSP